MNEARPQTFAEHVADYAQAGWPCILPVPPETKSPPPVGFTGAEGRDTDALQLVRWATSHASHSIALRMPDGVIGIDVDQYVKGGTQKHGAETLDHFIGQWGPLPATWTSTAREADGPSRIHFFRVPVQRYATKLTAQHADGTQTGDVEVIQRHHRYAVVWPSPHPGAGEGARYQWYDPQGQPCGVPKPDEFPELPTAWVEGLVEGATTQGPASADHVSGQALLDQLLDDWRPECADITSARLTATDALEKADSGSRHDTMTTRVHHLVQLAAAGHTGVAAAVAGLRESWARLTAGEDRGDELERMLLTSARKAVTAVGPVQVPRDPCLFAVGTPLPVPAPGSATGGGPDEDAPDAEIAEPPRWFGIREVIGAQAFDPNAGTDQALAEKVLERTYPALRYAYDAGAWLLRAPDRWETHGRLSSWAVAQVAPLMPVGDPTAEKGSEPHERAKRRTRLMSTAGARAVAGKMDDLVVGGMHPASIALSDLDADPELLWAGGRAWDLRSSLEEPVAALVDPATPHVRTAAVTPENRPTPLWDAFLEAVWPDPELRRWAVRVLSIAVTGYADRALPILLGETGRGKTQVVVLMMSVLGTYAHAANPKLLNSGDHGHDTVVFDLKGRRFSFIDEAPSEAKAGQERLKQLTGGGELTGRQMNQDPITFRPTHTLVLTANDEPVLTDPAVRSRIRLIPCAGDPEAVRRTRSAIGHVSGAAWRSEAPGVLAKLMAEAAGWLLDSKTALTAAAPEGIRYLAEKLGAEQDPVAVWVAEETEPFDTGTPSRELYQAFTSSCLRNNLRRDAIPSETKWGRTLTQLGYHSAHTAQGKRRPLRVRTGGFLPGTRPMTGPETASGQSIGPMPPMPPVEGPKAPETDQFDGPADGFVPGSNADPVSAYPQVNPSETVTSDGSDGSKGIYGSHTCARPRLNSRSGNAPNASHDPSSYDPTKATTPANVDDRPSKNGTVVDPEWREAHAEDVELLAEEAKRRKRRRSEAATKRAAEAKAEKRAAAIAEAAGTAIPLPAVVTRDGSARRADLADLDALLGTVTRDPTGELTVDVETSGYPVGHQHYALRTVQLGDEHFAAVLDPADPAQAEVIRRHMAAAPVLHAHSATADLVPLAHAGLIDHDDAWSRMHDTVVLAKLADPTSTGSDPGLKQIAAAMLGEAALSKTADEARAGLFRAGKWLTDTKVTTALERSGWAQVDSTCETMVRYAASDVLDDAAIARLLPQPEPEVLERERTAQRMVARVAHHGLPIDGDHVEVLLAKHTEARDAAAARVREASAGAIENPGSNQQVGEALTALGAQLPRTATGRPSVAEGVLDPFRADTGPVGTLATAVLEYREHDTALGTFLEPYRQLVRNGDGRARPTVYTLGADTGRMSCVRPNLQQVPREGGFRACITADPGHLLVSADFSGVELRVAAGLSQDTGLIAMIRDGLDLHAEVARQVWGPSAGKAERYIAKRGVFGRIYGGGVGTLAKQMGVSEAVAQQMIDSLDAITPGLSEWSRQVREGVKAGRTQFRTYSGRVAHLPKDFPHKAPNYCIQGTARELLVDALIRWADTPWGDAVLLPVHDELVVMVPEDQAEAATAALVDAMTTDLFGVPILAEASTPTYSWSDSV